MKSRTVKSSQSLDGLLLELNEAEVYFRTRVSIPMNVCSSVKYNASIGSLSGQITAQLIVGFRDHSGINLENLSLQQSTTITPTNGTVQLSLHAPLENLANQVSHWLVSSYVKLTITSELTSRLVIGNVSVSGRSTQEMCKVAIDIQALDGMSINTNPYTQELYHKPFINLTKHGSPDTWALFPITRPNEILYLQPGQYSGFAAWDFSYPLLYSKVLVNLTIGSNEVATWNIRLHCTRLFIQTQPVIPEMALWIFEGVSYPGTIFGYHPFNISVSDFIYLPISDGSDDFEIRVYTSPSYQYSYRDLPYSPTSRGELDSGHEWNLEITLPMSEFLGFGLRIEDVVIVSLGIASIFLMLVRLLVHFKGLGFSSVLRNPRLVPLIILCISIFLPWAEYSRTSSKLIGADSIVRISKMSPIALLLMWSSESDIILQPGVYWLDYIASEIRVSFDASALLLSSIFLFWIPIVYCYTRIGKGNEWKIEPEILLALVAPILLVCTAIIPNPLLTFEGLSIGSYIAASALPLFILAHLLYRIKMRSMGTQ